MAAPLSPSHPPTLGLSSCFVVPDGARRQQGWGFQLLRRLAFLWTRGVHDADDVGFRKVLEGTRDVPRVEGAWGGLLADHVHAGDCGAKTLHGEFRGVSA